MAKRYGELGLTFSGGGPDYPQRPVSRRARPPSASGPKMSTTNHRSQISAPKWFAPAAKRAP